MNVMSVPIILLYYNMRHDIDVKRLHYKVQSVSLVSMSLEITFFG